ncbi:MAG: hypothetical protein KF723_23015 [Rhizobiaceae bacterium]|nr:hypothetical protein [Rhizobiaceae bacterium]
MTEGDGHGVEGQGSGADADVAAPGLGDPDGAATADELARLADDDGPAAGELDGGLNVADWPLDAPPLDGAAADPAENAGAAAAADDAAVASGALGRAISGALGLEPTPPWASESEVLMQLFVDGPTWDGDLISKDERSELVDAGMAWRWNGWNFLTEFGVRAAIAGGLAASDWADQRWYRKAANLPPPPAETPIEPEDRGPKWDDNVLAATLAGSRVTGDNPDRYGDDLNLAGDAMSHARAHLAAAFLRANRDAKPETIVIHLRINGHRETREATGRVAVAWAVFAFTLNALDQLDLVEKAKAVGAELMRRPQGVRSRDELAMAPYDPDPRTEIARRL